MKYTLMLISFFFLMALSANSMAFGPSRGSLIKYNEPIGQCKATSITVKWDLDSLLGEPTVAGSFQWTGDSSCTLPSSTTIWLEIKTNDGAKGYVYLSPVTPKANSGYGYNTKGSPNWNSTLCGFYGTEKTGCLNESSAISLWKTGYVSDFIVTWRGSDTSQVDDAPDSPSQLSQQDKIEIIFDQLEQTYPEYLYPTAVTSPPKPEDSFYFRFYDTTVHAVAIEIDADELGANEIWYYYINDWYYFNTLDEANNQLCDGGCFNKINICNSPTIDIKGSVGYSYQGSRLTLKADKIKNNTQQKCISEELKLTLWAKPDDSHYYELGSVYLGQLESNYYFYDIEKETDLKTNIPNGNYNVILNVVSKFKENTPLDERQFKDQINISNGKMTILKGGTGGTGGTGRTSSCPSGTDKPYGDIQIDSQCQAACIYLEAGSSEGVNATCAILKGWESHSQIRASACGACR